MVLKTKIHTYIDNFLLKKIKPMFNKTQILDGKIKRKKRTLFHSWKLST